MAEKAFTPGSFQIFGGMDGASGDIAAAQRDDVPCPNTCAAA
jgi:hypothetical protein